MFDKTRCSKAILYIFLSVINFTEGKKMKGKKDKRQKQIIQWKCESLKKGKKDKRQKKKIIQWKCKFLDFSCFFSLRHVTFHGGEAV
jgi:hypothetical protein